VSFPRFALGLSEKAWSCTDCQALAETSDCRAREFLGGGREEESGGVAARKRHICACPAAMKDWAWLIWSNGIRFAHNCLPRAGDSGSDSPRRNGILITEQSDEPLTAGRGTCECFSETTRCRRTLGAAARAHRYQRLHSEAPSAALLHVYQESLGMTRRVVILTEIISPYRNSCLQCTRTDTRD